MSRYYALDISSDIRRAAADRAAADNRPTEPNKSRAAAVLSQAELRQIVMELMG